MVQKGLARQHHAGDAESALDRPHLAEGIDKRLPLRWPEALHGGDGLACAPPGAQDAAPDRLTGAAGPLAAPVLDGGQLQVVPQVAQKGFVLICLPEDAVDGKGIAFGHGWSLLLVLINAADVAVQRSF